MKNKFIFKLINIYVFLIHILHIKNKLIKKFIKKFMLVA